MLGYIVSHLWTKSFVDKDVNKTFVFIGCLLYKKWSFLKVTTCFFLLNCFDIVTLFLKSTVAVCFIYKRIKCALISIKIYCYYAFEYNMLETLQVNSVFSWTYVEYSWDLILCDPWVFFLPYFMKALCWYNLNVSNIC